MKKGFLIILLLVILFGLAGSVQAIDTIVKSYPNLPGAPDPTAGIPQYIRYIFVFSLGVVGIVAFISILLAAFGYVTSVGNPQKATAAKDRIFSSLLGILLLLGSYLLLNAINPDLLRFKITGEKVDIPVSTEEAATGCRLTGAYWDKPEINVYPVEYEGSSASDKVAATATVTFTLSMGCKDETYPVKPWFLTKTPHLKQIEEQTFLFVAPTCDGYFDSAREVPVEEDENPKFSWQFTFYKKYPNNERDKRCGGEFYTEKPSLEMNWGISDAACATSDDMLCNLRDKKGGQPEKFYLEGSIQLREDLPSQYVPRLEITVNDLTNDGVCCR